MLAKPQGFPRKLGGCAGLDPRLRSAVSAGVGDGERGLRRGLRAPGVGVRPKWVLEYSPSNKRIRYFVSITYVRTRQCVRHRVVAAMCLVHDARSAGPTAKSSYFPLPTIVADTGSANGTSGSRSPSFRNRNMSSAVSPRSGCCRTRLARSSSILMASTPPRPWGQFVFQRTAG